LLSATPGLAIQLAALLPLRSVYPKQADALLVNLDGVTIDDPGSTRDVSKGRI
jgi:hypothetical protein